MSLHKLANTIQKRGRGEDKMLVHMTPGEVKGLQALAMARGGSLTINPDTGLVEAGFLKRILPMVAGAALTGLSGGMINPLTASMMVGGFEGIRTGDVGKGLMAGLGAYGGAGLASGVTSAGASSIADTGGQAAVDQLGSQASTLSADQLGNLSAEQLQGLKSVSDSGMYNTADVLKTANAANTQVGAQNLIGANNFPNLNASQLQAYGDTLSSGAYNPADVIRSAGAQNATAGASGMQTAGAGFKAGPSAVYDALPTFTLPAAGMSLAAGALEPQPIPDTSKEKREYGEGAFLSPDFQAYTPRRPNPYYRPTGLGYAGGGLADVMLARGGTFDDEGQQDDFAMGGSIGGYSDGGRMLKGPGDGMSDSIPGIIGKRQPARLADGEFVVPADVVSHLGNGSTDAGAKRLYAMMDKVRKARTGKKKQAPAVKASRYMPA
jgi:hypothetical protein